jgi:hypothetical protein
MPQLSEWLQIMLAEVARKQEEAEQAALEVQRRADAAQTTPAITPKYLSKQT